MKKHRALGSETLVFLFPSSSDIFLCSCGTRLPFATTVGAGLPDIYRSSISREKKTCNRKTCNTRRIKPWEQECIRTRVCNAWSLHYCGALARRNGACANYVTVPGFHGFEDAQTGWVARQKLTDASCRERYCWEGRKRVEFRLWTELGRVFLGFKRVKSYVLCIGVANIHVKKNQGLAFHRTGDRHEALLCPIVMKSVTNKHPRMWDFFC